jgi:hypothetical protein
MLVAQQVDVSHVFRKLDLVLAAMPDLETGEEQCRAILEKMTVEEWRAIQGQIKLWYANQVEANNAFGITFETLLKCKIEYGGRFLDESVLTRRQKRRVRTAVHEAGHAVIASELAQHARLVSIVVNRKDNRNGITTYNKSRQVSLAHQICVIMAGPAAERHHYGRIPPKTGCGGDVVQICQVLSELRHNGARIPGEIRNKLVELYWRETNGLVHMHRAEIGRVAQMLLKHGRVIYDPETASFVPVTQRKPPGVDEASWVPTREPAC